MERGKLTQALDCLQHAHKLAPQEDYILKHLKIVQQRLSNLKQAPGMHHQKTIAFEKYDPTDFGGATTETNTIIDGSDGELEGITVPPKSSETIKTDNIAAETIASASVAEILITDKSNKNSNDNSCTESTQQTECTANGRHDKNTHTKKTVPPPQSPPPPKSTTSASASLLNRRRSTTNNENRKFSEKSTILFDNFIHKTDQQQQINTNQRYRKRTIQESSLPMFVHPYVHDMDDPSSGTS